jgi:triacylglycerol lipase
MRFKPNQPSDEYTKQVGMTLAEIAYAEPQYLPAQLAYRDYAGGGAYRLQWLGVTPGNQMYVCQIPGLDQWIVSIRGSQSDPLTEAFWINWFEQDLTVMFQVPLPFGQKYNGGAQISWGTEQGFDDLISMTDVRTGQTLVQYLKANATFTPGSIVVVGHSLGGCLASVLAPYLYETLGRPNGHSPEAFLPITFAAPTAGDMNFAKYVNGLFDGYPYRFENSLDIAPRCWSLAGLDWVLQSYQPSPQIGAFFYGLVDSIWWILYERNYHYVQPGPGVIDPGSPGHNYWWFREAGLQHAGETYLKMYKAPQVIFPVPRTSPTPIRSIRAPHPPVAHHR